jgi:membrane protein YdbS with pleckstrin-like domain
VVPVSDYQSLDLRYIPLQREVGRIVTGVLSVALLAGLFVLLTPRRWPWCVALWIVGTLVLAWASHWWPTIEYRHIGYRVDDDGIEIQMGVYWRRVLNVPRARVQHTDVVQGPLERRHGLGRLLIYTAGTEHSRVELPGLEHQTALGIRDRLLPREAADAV